VGLTVLGKEPQPRLRLVVGPDGAPQLALMDKDGKVLFLAPNP